MSPVIRTIWTQQSEDQASDSHENGDDGEVSVLKLQYAKECVFLVVFLKGGMMQWRCWMQ